MKWFVLSVASFLLCKLPVYLCGILSCVLNTNCIFVETFWIVFACSPNSKSFLNFGKTEREEVTSERRCHKGDKDFGWKHFHSWFLFRLHCVTIQFLSQEILFMEDSPYLLGGSLPCGWEAVGMLWSSQIGTGYAIVRSCTTAMGAVWSTDDSQQCQVFQQCLVSCHCSGLPVSPRAKLLTSKSMPAMSAHHFAIDSEMMCLPHDLLFGLIEDCCNVISSQIQVVGALVEGVEIITTQSRMPHLHLSWGFQQNVQFSNFTLPYLMHFKQTNRILFLGTVLVLKGKKTQVWTERVWMFSTVNFSFVCSKG